MSNKSALPKHPGDIVDRILHYGAFKEALEYLSRRLESEISSSIIFRGSAGIGKTSLVEEALEQCDVISVWLHPSHFTEDFAALRYVAMELGLDPRTSLKEIMEDIEVRSLKTKKKIVIVLSQFEEFCRKHQSLLYNLTHLTQHGKNMSLIGLTYSLDCTEHLEKRVRSRINAEFYFLEPPYKDLKEYTEFASLLLGGLKISDQLKAKLEELYATGNKSIRPLKRLLVSSVVHKNGKLVEKKELPDTSQDEMRLLEERFSWLISPQLEMFKMAIFYCNENSTVDFTLTDLEEFARKQHHTKFNSTNQFALKNATFLVKNGFFRQLKPNQMIDEDSTLTINIMPSTFKAVMMKHPEFGSIKTDNLWKKIR